MNYIDALILGIIQGLTEFLPVSSSGHLEIGKQLLGVEATDNLIFTVVVHVATVLSTIVVFWKDLMKLIQGAIKFKWNEETQYLAKIAISLVPIMIIGLFFKDYVEEVFNSGAILIIVGCSLLFTGLLLGFTYYRKSGEKDISMLDAFIIGVAQVVAIVPGISRSGSTIATGLLLGDKKKEVARFSFLMVLIPIFGENILSLFKADYTTEASISKGMLVVGLIAAFIAGLMACKWMIKIVQKGKLIWFAIYCAIVGVIAIAGYLL